MYGSINKCCNSEHKIIQIAKGDFIGGEHIPKETKIKYKMSTLEKKEKK